MYDLRRYITEPVVTDHKIDVEKGLKDQIVWLNLRDFLKEESKSVFLVSAYGYTERSRASYELSESVMNVKEALCNVQE